jgi:uncharacterized membrane protein SpoIIM required for sporulation/ABC-type transport system involved in multi-copper enzyme maturation permease subunit
MEGAMINNFKLVLTIVKREVRDQFRDWRITLPIIFLTAVFPFIIGYVSNQVVRFVQSYDADIVAENMVPFFLLVVGFFPVTVSLVIATESFVGEKERRSIEPLLASPLEDWELFIGKLISVMFPPLFGSFIGMFVYIFGVYLEFGFIPNIPLLILVTFLTITQASVMVSAAVVVSTQSTTVRSANLLTSFIVVPMAFLIQWEAITMFWGNYKDLWWVVLGLGILTLLFIRVGITHFNREELIGQEFDQLNLRWMISIFKENFLGNAKTVFDWYRKEVFPTIKIMALPLACMFILISGAWWFGINQAEIFKIPLDWFSIKDGVANFQNSPFMNLFSGETIIYILFHNIRSMLLGTLLGIISFGIAGVLVLLIPIALIAFFMVPFSEIGIPAWKYITGLVLPHGIFEIPAILLLGAALLKIGASLATPSKGEPISEGFVRSLADWAKIMIGLVIPLLLFAAIMEVLVTPRTAIWLFTN